MDTVLLYIHMHLYFYTSAHLAIYSKFNIFFLYIYMVVHVFNEFIFRKV